MYIFHVFNNSCNQSGGYYNLQIARLPLTYQGFIAQLLEQHTEIWEVMGSNPVKVLKYYFTYVFCPS